MIHEEEEEETVVRIFPSSPELSTKTTATLTTNGVRSDMT